MHFYRQKPLDGYIADFYCPKLKLVIEIDGNHHLSGGQKECDDERMMILESYKLKVLRFTNYKVDSEFEKVCNQISGLINNPL